MSDMVQVALAEDIADAEEIQAILDAAGIDSVLETAVEHHPSATEDAPAEGARRRVLARGGAARDRGDDGRGRARL